MHLVPLSILAAALITAAAPSPDPAEITIKVDLTSDNDAAGNFPTPLDSFPRLDITEGHGGDEPNLHERKFNLYYNFTLSASVQTSRRPAPPSLPVGFRPGVPFAEFGRTNSKLTLCRGHLLYDNYVSTVGPPTANPAYLSLGSSQSAFIFETEVVLGRRYIRFYDRNFRFASIGLPQTGDRVAAISGQGPSLFTLFSFSPLSLSP